ncbi:MAG: efflux RND transporter periplasmic adaptor subunit [Anaerolineales bacterium]
MAFIRRRWLPLIVVLVVLAAGWYFLGGLGAARADSLSGLQTAVASRGSLTATIGATGSVRPQQSATLLWGTSGKVGTVLVEVGDRVAADETIATLELSSLPQAIILANIDLQDAQNALALELVEAAKAAAEAQNALEKAEKVLYNLTHPGKAVDIDQAFANMVLAKDRLDKAREDYEPYANKPETNLNRANYLLRFTEAQKAYDSAVRIYNSFVGTANNTDIAVAEGQVALAQEQLLVAQNNYETALQASDPEFVSSAEARVAAAQATIDLANIKAPFAGVITDAEAAAGDLVSSGSLAFKLDDLSHMLVDVEVSEVDVNRVAVGQDAIITFDAAADREYHGQVTSMALAGTITSGVVNFRVTVELSDADEFVRPGMTAAVNVVVSQLDDVLLVPNRAVRVVDGARVVYVLRGDALAPVEITLGASSETYSEVTSGELQAGDLIVLNPPANAFDMSSPPSGGRFLMGGS